MGIAEDGADSAVLAASGDGASSQGDVDEAFVFSAVSTPHVLQKRAMGHLQAS
ncbi:hypothetical protein STANM309S_06599 [Streptomyces tanashiensis]